MVIAAPSGLLQLIYDMMSEGWFITAKKKSNFLADKLKNKSIFSPEDGIPLVPRGCFPAQALSN